MKIKSIVSALLMAAVFTAPAFSSANNEVSAALAYNRRHYSYSGASSVSGKITFDGSTMTTISYDGNWLGTRATASKTAQSGKHSCGVSGGGKSKWTNDTTVANIQSGRVSNGYVNVMGLYFA